MAKPPVHITCPSCDAIFKVDTASLGGKAARKVRCAICRHIWTAQIRPSTAPENPADKARAALKSRAQTQEQPTYFPNITATGVETLNADQVFDTRGLQPGYRRTKFLLRILGLPLLVVMVVGFLFWSGRDWIAERFPQSQEVYTFLGIPLSNQFDGFSLSNQTTVWREAETDQQQLLISADLKNTGDTAREVPDVRVNLFDSNGGLQKFWVKSFEGQRLDPGETLRINTDMVGPPADTTFIRLTITPDP
jgi:predicted Zn finger-like uncharacterized protein